jgi:hypothetical protein
MFKVDNLARSQKKTFCSAGKGSPFPAIGSEFQWCHPHPSPALNRARAVDGLFASPSKLMVSQKLRQREIVILSQSEESRIFK